MSTAKHKPDISVHFKVWLESHSGEGIMGHGKWMLLKKIDETGSLRAAAAKQEISYRKAWGDLKKMEELLGISLIEKHRGGASGGNTVLTPEGKKWVKAYLHFLHHVEKLVDSSFQRFIKDIA